MWQAVLLDVRRAGEEHSSLVRAESSVTHLSCLLFQGINLMPKKQSSSKLSTLASKVLSGEKKPTLSESKKLAASVLSQDETKGQRK